MPDAGTTGEAQAQESAGAASTFGEAGGAGEDGPPVTVLKSGVVDGMAYSLYSDGSIDAQTPAGMMRFASIDDVARPSRPAALETIERRCSCHGTGNPLLFAK